MLQVVSKYGEMSGKGALTITTINGADKVVPPSAPVWGSITGTLSAQTDLQSALNAKQDTLVSGTNIKTINSNSILGSGDLAITASAVWGAITGTLSSQTDLQTALNAKVNLAGDSMTGYLTLNADPTSSLHAATKQYVDNITAGINFHSPCHVATTGNLVATYSNGVSGVGATLTATSVGALSIDSHSPVVTDRVLVWQQTAGLENGIYEVTDAGSPSTPWILTRATDADNSPAGELSNGDFTFIQQGATYGGFGFILNTTGTITVGVTAINYVQFNAAQVVAAGYGLQELTPNVLSVDTSLIATVSSLSAYLTSATAAATYYPLTNPAGYTSNLGTVTSISTSGPLTGGPITSSGTIGITQAGLVSDGYVSSADWNMFKGKQDALLGTGIVKSTAGVISYLTDNSTDWDTAYTNRITTLTTTGSSGASTLVSNTLNIPNYTLAGLGGVPTSRTITINGTTQDLSADRTFTVTSADPAGFTYIIKSADQDVTNSATFVPDTELQFSVVANGFYMIEMHLAYSGNDVVGDYKYNFNVSAGTMSGTGSATSLATGGGTILNGVTVNATATTSTVPCGVNTANFNFLHSSFCTFSFFASANGTFRMQFANNSAGAGRTSRTNKGSILKYKKIN